MKVAIIHAGADSIEEFVEAKEIESNLDTYYSEIGCDCIEIPERCIGGKLFNIICDEEGLLKDHPILSAVGNGYQEAIFGNLIVCGLADDDQNIILMAYRKKPEIFYLNKSYWSVQLKQFGGEHLQWAPGFLEYRDSLKKKNFKNWARGIKHKVNCLKYAWRIYKHMSKVKIH